MIIWGIVPVIVAIVEWFVPVVIIVIGISVINRIIEVISQAESKTSVVNIYSPRKWCVIVPVSVGEDW